MNIAQTFKSAYQHAAAAPCLLLPGLPAVSFQEMDDLSARFAAAFVEAGLRPGERVVAQVEKSVGNVALYLGVLRAGGVYVPLNTGYTPSEVSYFLADSEPRIVICRSEDKGSLAKVAEDIGAVVATMDRDPSLGLWATATKTAALAHIVERRDDDLAAIVYTSGTTGRAKGAMLSHGNMRDNAEVLLRIWGFNASDVLIHALPIYHAHGLFVALHTSLLNATPMIFMETFDAARVREHMPHATMLMGVPTFYARLAALANFGPQDCRNIRVFISGSAPLTQQASDAWTEITGHRILERYGMSEALMITSNPLDGQRIAGTVGYALPGYSVRIADHVGNELPRGEIGGIEIRGPSLFKGYWRMPEKTSQEFRADGYFVTGDTGKMDETGRVTIVGRAKDLIIAGGYNIYPREIEQVLDDIPGIAESAVVGVPHPEMGEGAVAVLVPQGQRPTDEAVMNALNASLARFKHPRRFYWVDELPRNTMGKVQKSELRKRYAGAYQAASG